MLGKTVAVLALAASLGAIGISPSLASGKPSLASATSTVGTGWNDTNANAAQDRANLIENVLTSAAVAKVKHLRSIVAPPVSPTVKCRTQSIVSPLLAGGYLYAVTDGKVSKYNPATGHLIWQRSPPAPYAYSSLAISGPTNTLIASASDCTHPNDPPGIVTAYNATTGKQIWSNTSLAGLVGGAPVEVFGSYVIVAGLDRDGGFRWVLNLGDGTTVWSSGGCNDDNNPILPLVVGGLAIVPNQACDGFQARNLATGAILWDLHGSGPGGYGFRAGDLSGTAGTHLFAIDSADTTWDVDPQTGQVEYSLGQSPAHVQAVDQSRVYTTCASGGTAVCAYNKDTGALGWQVSKNQTIWPIAAEADGVLYLGTGQALNAATGRVIKTLWSFSGSSRPPNALAVGNGRIAVVTEPRILDLYGLPGY
jgi:outer membrane protein assembly factor BamB